MEMGFPINWLGNLDSNQDKQSQSLLCYRYTIPHKRLILNGFQKSFLQTPSDNKQPGYTCIEGAGIAPVIGRENPLNWLVCNNFRWRAPNAAHLQS